MQNIICAICGKKQQKKIIYRSTFKNSHLNPYIFSARRVPDNVHYQLNRCERCELIFSSPILSDKEILDFYSKSYLSYKSQVKFLENTYLELFKKIISNLPLYPNVLEIGCGDGFFLKKLKKNKIKNLYGVEPSRKMVESMPAELKKNIKISPFKKGLFPKNFFDVVCCFHTLDHVKDPNELISETRIILKKGGIALFIIHDTGSLSVKIFGEKSPIFDIEHIYLFNKKNISTIFVKNKFNILEVKGLKNTYPLWYWIKMAGVSQIIKRIFLRSTKLFGIEKKPISLRGGNIYIIAKK